MTERFILELNGPQTVPKPSKISQPTDILSTTALDNGSEAIPSHPVSLPDAVESPLRPIEKKRLHWDGLTRML